ncbi:MAG: hypothetical protein R2932_58725 [Caldilineaceae bacterium]
MMLGEDFYVDTAQAIAAAVGCLLNGSSSATHTHSSPTDCTQSAQVGRATAFSPLIICAGPDQAVHAGRGSASPWPTGNRKRMGYGASVLSQCQPRCDHPETHLWYQGPNPDGPSDKTVAVLKFESLDGEPIAIYVNYAMHANLMFMRNEIGGGFPAQWRAISKNSMTKRYCAGRRRWRPESTLLVCR